MKDPKFKLNKSMACGIYHSLQNGSKNGKTSSSLINYTVEDLKVHLEKQFLPGMTWENHGEWHIDHIIPKSLFNFSTPDHIDFKRCWSLSNL